MSGSGESKASFMVAMARTIGAIPDGEPEVRCGFGEHMAFALDGAPEPFNPYPYGSDRASAWRRRREMAKEWLTLSPRLREGVAA